MRRTLHSALLGALLTAGSCSLTALAQTPAPPPPPDAAQAPTDQAPPPMPPKHRPKPNPNREMKKLTMELSLTSDQQAKIQPVIETRDQQIASAEADTTLSAKQQKRTARSAEMNADSQIETLLTDAQRTQYEQMKAAKGGGRRRGVGGPPPSMPPSAAPSQPQPMTQPQ